MADSEFAEVHDELRAVARDLLEKVGAGEWAPAARLAEPGWLGLEVPEALGGAGATFAETAIVAGELGRAAVGSAYFGSAVLGAGALALVAPGADRDALLRGIAAGETVVAVALVDGDGDGGDIAPPFLLDGSRLRGRAAFVPDADVADRLLLLARDNTGEPVLVDVPPNAAGLDRRAQPVLDETRRFGLITAADVAIGDEAVWRFAGDAEAAVRTVLDRAALAVACDSLGVAERMLAATVEYAGIRTQFGRPIGSFQAVKHACADMLVSVTVSRRLVASAVRALVDGTPEAATAVSMAKSSVCAAAVDVAGKAMQLHGGVGYTWESGVHAYLKRATLGRALFGSPAAHRARIAQRYRQ